MSLNDLLASDAGIFVDADLMPGVESVTYRVAGGRDVVIPAQVFRLTPDQGGDVAVMKTTIFVPRALVPVVTLSGDRVTLNDQAGKPASYLVVSIVSEDVGGFILEVQ